MKCACNLDEHVNDLEIIMLRKVPLDTQIVVYLNPIEINRYIRWTKSYVNQS